MEKCAEKHFWNSSLFQNVWKKKSVGFYRCAIFYSASIVMQRALESEMPTYAIMCVK